MSVTVTVDASGPIRYLRGAADRAEDARPVFQWARSELEEANARNFASGGLASGRRWAPLDREYRAWKGRHAGGPTMIFSGRLMRSLTRLTGPPNEIGRRRASFGTNIPYAGFHQRGTSIMPRRTIVFVPTTFAFEFARQEADYIVNETGSAIRVRGIFR